MSASTSAPRRCWPILLRAPLLDPNNPAEPRFTMLETIREYALEQLAQSAAETSVRRRHADVFLARADRAPHAPIGHHIRIDRRESQQRQRQNAGTPTS